MTNDAQRTDRTHETLEDIVAEVWPHASSSFRRQAAAILDESGRRSVGMEPWEAHAEANRAAGRLRRLQD